MQTSNSARRNVGPGRLRMRIAGSLVMMVTASGCLSPEGDLGHADQESLLSSPVYQPKDELQMGSRVYARFDWAMTPRAFKARAIYQQKGERFPESYIYPDHWTVAFDACSSAAVGTTIKKYKWQFKGPNMPTQTRETTRCLLSPYDIEPVAVPGCEEPPYLGGLCDVDFDAPVGAATVLPPTFPTLGKYEVTLTVVGADGKQATSKEVIELRDVLVVSLGDSMSSGEGVPHDQAGNPQIAALLSTLKDMFEDTPLVYQVGSLVALKNLVVGIVSLGYLADFFFSEKADWWDEPCHRSFFGAPALAAMMFDAANPHVSVTFVSHACSGAKVRDLFVTAQKKNREHQIQATKRNLCRGAADCALTQRRAVDVVMMSAGINDLDFPSLISACIQPDCWGIDCPVIDDDCLDESRDKDIASLADKYAGLDAALTQQLDPTHVFIVEYPANVFTEHGPDGKLYYEGCGILDMNDAEAEHLHQIGTKLNLAVKQGAQQHGWHYVGGVVGPFEQHGYCTDDPWYVHFGQSLEGQEDIDGTVHPNYAGHGELAKIMAANLQSVLIPGGLLESLPEWPARTAGGAQADDLRAVVRYDDGDIVVGGTFQGTMWLDNKALAADGGEDGWVARLDPKGTLRWISKVGGAGSARVVDVALGPSGNVVVTGVFKDQLKLAGAILGSNAWDGFVASFDGATGQAQWVRGFTGAGSQQPTAVAVDPTGRVIVTGYFDHSISTPGVLGDAYSVPGPNPTLKDCFLTWLGSDGALLKLTAFGGTGYCNARDVATDRQGAAFVVGSFSGTLELAPGKKRTSDGSGDAFIVKYGPTGAHQWHAYIGGINYYSPGENVGDAAAYTVAVDAAGAAHVAGTFRKTAFVSDGSSSYFLGSPSTWDAFVLRFDGKGKTDSSSIRVFGGSGDDFAFGLDVTPDGAYAVSGRYGSSDMKVLNKALCLRGAADAFVAVFRPEHTLRLARRYGQTGATTAWGVSLGEDGSVLIGGEFWGSISVGDGLKLTSKGLRDGFLNRVKAGDVEVMVPWGCQVTAPEQELDP